MTDLKPCPFCGGEAYMETPRFYRLPNAYRVRCLDCKAQTYSFYTTEQEAANAWNKRADIPNKCRECAVYMNGDCIVYKDGGCPAFKEKEDKNGKDNRIDKC